MGTGIGVASLGVGYVVGLMIAAVLSLAGALVVAVMVPTVTAHTA